MYLFPAPPHNKMTASLSWSDRLFLFLFHPPLPQHSSGQLQSITLCLSACLSVSFPAPVNYGIFSLLPDQSQIIVTVLFPSHPQLGSIVENSRFLHLWVVKNHTLVGFFHLQNVVFSIAYTWLYCFPLHLKYCQPSFNELSLIYSFIQLSANRQCGNTQSKDPRALQEREMCMSSEKCLC